MTSSRHPRGERRSLPGRAVERGRRLRSRIYRWGVWDSNLAVLFPLLAWGVLVHKSQLPEPFTAPWPPLATVAAIAVLWLPRSVLAAELLVVSVALESAWIQPSAVNHSVLLLFVTAGGALLAARSRLRSGWRSIDTEALEADLAPLVRGGVYLLFGFAVLHKLNHGFLDPTGSCAVAQYANLHGRFPFLPAPGPRWLNTGLVAVTLATEASIPLLLWRPATRMGGLCVAFVFHLVMGLNGHHGFSALAPALYVPFFGGSLHVAVAAAFEPGAGHPWIRRLWWVIVGASTALGALLLAGGVTGMLYLGFEAGIALFLVGYPSIFLVLLALGAEPARRENGAGGRMVVTERPPRRRSGAPLPVVSAVLLGALVLNASSPYLGLKTESAFAMFSNLRTEGGAWNHLFLPAELRLFALQDTLVRFESVPQSEGALRSLVDSDARVVPVQARQLVAEACASSGGPLPATISVAGTPTTYVDLCTTPWGDDDRSWAARKVLVFRPVPPVNVCTH